MAFLLTQGLVLSVLAVAVLSAGAPWARRLGCAGLAERLGWSLAFGCLFWAEAAVLAGFAHVLTAPVVAALGLAVVIVGGRDAWRLAVDALAWARAGRARRAAAVGAVLFAAPVLVSALYPPFEWDETIYHLVFARGFAASGSLPYLVEARVPVFPPLAEALSAALLSFADDVATHWVAMLATLGTALLLLSWVGVSRRTRLLAASLFVGSPMVIFLAGLGYVDPLLTLFATAAVAALERARREASWRWLAAAGLAAGAAAGVKYLGLFVAGWVAAEALFTWAGGWRRRLAAACATGSWSAVVAVPVYVRIVAWSGSPLFPFYAQIFGTSPWAYVPEPTVAPGLVPRIGASLAVVWRSVFERAKVGELPPFEPLWPFVVALLVVGAVRSSRSRWALALLAAYLLAIPPNARYVLPLVPYVGLAGVATLEAWPTLRQASRRAVAAAALGLALPGWLYALHLCWQRGPVPTTAAAREAFLTRRLDCFSSVAFLNRNAPTGYRAFGLPLERLAGLAKGRWFGDVSGPWSFDRAALEIARDGARAAVLREAAADYLVVEEPLAQRLTPSLERTGARLVFRDGACVTFALTAR